MDTGLPAYGTIENLEGWPVSGLAIFSPTLEESNDDSIEPSHGYVTYIGF